MNSDMVKPEKFGHLHLVYHFTLPLLLKMLKYFEVMLNIFEFSHVKEIVES